MIDIVIPAFSSPFEVFWWLFTHGGYIAVVIAFLFGGWWVYLDAIQTRFMNGIRYVLLAVDVPKENEQTPKAVEHIFSHIHGIHKPPNLIEQYIDGFVQPAVSFELVSFGGYIQYLIRCPADNRDIIEAAIYAQYPNAEISEVEDYVNQFKPVFPNDEYDLWATEIVPYNSDVYPIKTYPLWEHSLTQTFLDPMASILEMLSRIQQGEQIWLQLIARPTLGAQWRQKGIDTINKIAGIKGKAKSTLWQDLAGAPLNLATGAWQTLTRTLFEPGADANSKSDDPPSLMLHLPPNQRVVLEAVGMKISKIPYEVKFRFVYVADKRLFSKSRVSGVIGSIKQFNTLDMNGFKPDSKMKTKRDYFMVKRRENALKRRILLGYKYRSMWAGAKTFILNIEELASVWHFPVMTVKAPLVKKTEAKRGEPPVSLPIGDEIEYVPKPPPKAPTAPPPAAGSTAGNAPGNLPIG